MQWIAFFRVAGRTHQSKVEEGIYTIFAPITATIHYENETAILWPRLTRDFSSSVLKTFRGGRLYNLSGQPVLHLTVIMVKKNLSYIKLESILFPWMSIFSEKGQDHQFQSKEWEKSRVCLCLSTTKLLQDNLWGQCKTPQIYSIISSLNHRKRGKKRQGKKRSCSSSAPSQRRKKRKIEKQLPLVTIFLWIVCCKLQICIQYYSFIITTKSNERRNKSHKTDSLNKELHEHCWKLFEFLTYKKNSAQAFWGYPVYPLSDEAGTGFSITS